MTLPENYYVKTTEGGRVLIEDTEVYQILPQGHAEVLAYEVRTVACFPNETSISAISEIARLDKQSRNKAIAPCERHDALEDLATKFREWS